MKKLIYSLVILLAVSNRVTADHPLDETKALQILNQLCQQSISGWITQGQIEGVHICTDLESGETIETKESVTIDGERFSWNIQVVSRENDKEAKRQEKSDYLKWNQNRTFTWDGFTYTLYFNPGNHAIVYESPSIPVTVTGPLRAGCIPWGSGNFSYDNLSSGKLSAKEVQTDVGPQIHIAIELNDNTQMTFVLDPGKDLAVLSYTKLQSGAKMVQSYGDFMEHSGRWIPMTIVIDHYYNDRLLTCDDWGLTVLKDNSPAESSFKVSLRKDALVERHSPILEEPVFYRHRKDRDIQPLLEKRFTAALKKNIRKQNCATVAVETILSGFGIELKDNELESLILDDSNSTSLYNIEQFMLNKGLFCLPIKTDISGLERFKDTKVLLHFPMKKHFVILDKIEQDNVWIIDIDRQTFYYSMDRERFEQAWAGIAMVVSDAPVTMDAGYWPVPDPVLQKIVGSADYSCRLIQGGIIDFCPGMSPMGRCAGRYTIWENYYACQPDNQEGGYCVGTEIVGGMYAPCVEMGTNICSTNGDYNAQPIRMCTP